MKTDRVVRRHGVFGLACWAAIVLAAPLAAATPQQIDEAIKKGKEYLYSQQKNGNWELVPQRDAAGRPWGLDGGQWGGLTSLATYALMAAGDGPQNAHIKPAIEWLQQADIVGTYALGMRCQVWQQLALDDPKNTSVRTQVERDGALLLKTMKTDADASGLFDYYLNVTKPGVVYKPNGRWDDSVSQFGMLGLWACAEGGFEVSDKYWKRAEAAWLRHQDANGGWCYLLTENAKQKAWEVNASMSAAGIATLYIIQDFLHSNDGIDCTGNIKNPHIDAGLEWMNKNFAEALTTPKGYPIYMLYGVSRIGVASGRKYFGTSDWFSEGADYLIKRQEKNGSWPGGYFGFDGHIPDTAFALLFLARGRAPVLMNKLEYAIDTHGDTPKLANWNQRPRDVANFAKWVGRQTEQFLNWQSVNLKVPSTDLHDAPVLYIAGGEQALDFSDEEINKLRQYVDDGGLIYGNADCGSSAFTTSLVKVCRKLFPDYEFADLPLESPIFNNEQFHRDKFRSSFKVQSLSNGARELVIIVPTADPSRYWQTQTYGGHEELFQFADDVFLYAIDKGERGGLRVKGDTYIVLSDPKIHPAQAVKIARLQYAGNWNPEPGSWRRLAAVMHNTDKVDLDVQGVQLGASKLDNTFKIAHLTGPFKFSLTQAARDEIKKYVLDGGTLIADACGGRSDFAQSAENELAAIFPDNKLGETPLSLSGPVLGSEPKLNRVDYRGFARSIVGSLHTPRIRAIDINGRPAVFFSAEDMSVGMVGMQIDGIYGYDPASATALMEKLVLFAANNK